MVYDILDVYKMLYEDLLAVPVVQGVKSEMEKFAGKVVVLRSARNCHIRW